MFYDQEYFGNRLAQLRTEKGVSARDMSLSVGQNEGYINNIENKNNFPSMAVFFYICEYLEITPKEFFDDIPAPHEANELFEEIKGLKKEQLDVIRQLIKKMK